MLFFNRCIAGFLHVVVRSSLWLYRQISTSSSVIRRLVCRAGRSIVTGLHSAWRRPFETTAVILLLGVAWLIVGTTPLLSLTGSVIFGRWVGQCVFDLLCRCFVRTRQPEEPHLPPQRNGRPLSKPSGVA